MQFFCHKGQSSESGLRLWLRLRSAAIDGRPHRVSALSQPFRVLYVRFLFINFYVLAQTLTHSYIYTINSDRIYFLRFYSLPLLPRQQ